jgi:hypothetical protein
MSMSRHGGDDSEPRSLEQAAVQRRRTLRQLTSRAVDSQTLLQFIHVGLAQAFWQKHFVLMFPRVFSAERRDARPLGLEFHRQAEMLVAPVLEEMPRQVVLLPSTGIRCQCWQTGSGIAGCERNADRRDARLARRPKSFTVGPFRKPIESE